METTTNTARTYAGRKAVYAITALFILAAVIGITPVFASHVNNVQDYEWHIWSRNAADGHLTHLACDSQNNYCALKIKTVGGIQTHSQSVINSEVDAIEAHFDSLNKKMSIDRVTSANSVIMQDNLDRNTNGWTDYDLHCTNYIWFWCFGKDFHFTSMSVKLNNSSNEVNFQLEENEANKEYDIRKTLGHELFHAMGIDHNRANNSIVNYQYLFGADKGYTANAEDIQDLERRYP